MRMCNRNCTVHELTKTSIKFSMVTGQANPVLFDTAVSMDTDRQIATTSSTESLNGMVLQKGTSGTQCRESITQRC